MHSSEEPKIEKINVYWAGLEGEVGKETSAWPLLPCCPFSAIPRTPGPLNPVSTPLCHPPAQG